MIIWGSTTREVSVGQGECYCPRCSQQQPYQLMESKRYFTLYFIPLFPMYSQGQHVACQRCGGTFSTDVLTIGGPPAQQYGPTGQGATASAPPFNASPDSIRQVLALVCGKTGRVSADAVERLKQLLQHSGLPVPADDHLQQELQMAAQTHTTIGQFAGQFVGAPESFRQQVVESAKWIVDDGRPLSLSDKQVLNQLASALRVHMA